MISKELADQIEEFKDSELLRFAMKWVGMAFLETSDNGDDPEEVLDYIYMECSRRGKEWIFDKAQEAFLKQNMENPASEEQMVN